MHEMSIALEICRLAENALGRRRLSQVVEVGLEVGDDSGVEIDNLQFCLEALLCSPPFRKAEPRIRREPGDGLSLSYVEIDDDRPEN